jgi:hypothetical protein
MSNSTEGVRYPDGWSDSSNEQREQWAGEADLMLAKGITVPRDSLHSFAVVWKYVLNKASGRRKSIGASEQNADEDDSKEVREESEE